MRVHTTWAATTFLLCCCGLGQGATIRVPGDQPTIQAGIDAASPGDTVLVASGVYSGVGNRDIDFGGKDLVLTSESGSGGTVIDCEGSSEDPHRAFCFSDATAVIRGFTIRNGYADEDGGGIYCRDTALSLADCAVTDCAANTVWNGVVYSNGGGMYCSDCTLTVEDCVFSSNASGWLDSDCGVGGGVSCTGSGVFRGCMFNGNRAAASGGGVYAWGDFTFTSCTFQGNRAEEPVVGSGGGFGGSAVFEDVTFSGNYAGYEGGGACASGTFRNVIFSDNRAGRWWGGRGRGGGLSGGGDLTVTDATFTRNTAMHVGGAIDCSGGVFENIVISYNLASFAGGISCEGDPTFRNVTLVRNDNLEGGGPSAVLCSGGSPTFTQVIMAFGSGYGGWPVACWGGDPTFLCCDIYGNFGGDWVDCIADQYGLNGNISEDPLFCGPSTGDFTVAENSPCTPANNSCGMLIGALDVGCNPTPVEAKAWGTIKAMFR